LKEQQNHRCLCKSTEDAMDPLLVVFGVRSAIRLAGVGREALARAERGQALFVPALGLPEIADDDWIRGRLIGRDLPVGLEPSWQSFTGTVPRRARDRDLLLAEALRVEAEENPGLSREQASRAAGAALIGQWGNDAPVGPVGMLVLALADTAIDFASLRPSCSALAGAVKG
jgi:hypothetical protein